jgi:hypothetical protein
MRKLKGDNREKLFDVDLVVKKSPLSLDKAMVNKEDYLQDNSLHFSPNMQ